MTSSVCDDDDDKMTSVSRVWARREQLHVLPLVTYTEGKSGQIKALRIHSVYVHEVASNHQLHTI